jgi:hypothetical protein
LPRRIFFAVKRFQDDFGDYKLECILVYCPAYRSNSRQVCRVLRQRNADIGVQDKSTRLGRHTGYSGGVTVRFRHELLIVVSTLP